MKFTPTLPFIFLFTILALNSAPTETPNIIMLLADDLGYGEVGFNGNERIQTPNLDQMAEESAVLTRFYTASSICSPTRGSILTGRHPYRYGVLAAHTGGMRIGEITIAEILKEQGYSTGFFGKWHLGWLDPNEDNSRGIYSPPWIHGFEETFCTKSAVPTWNPCETPKGWNQWGQKEGTPWKGGFPYWENGERVMETFKGDDSRVIMDKAIGYIEKQAKDDSPFLAVIWFHTPHEPVVAGPEYLELYKDLEKEEQRHYYGCITAMDEQIGRLRQKLQKLGQDENTIIFFASDNGTADPIARKGIGSTAGLRGHKHTHYEGGIRVPSIVSWPGHFNASKIDTMYGTVDYLPTILDMLNLQKEKAIDKRPLDGISFLNELRGEYSEPTDRILTSGYMRLYKKDNGIAMIQGRYKLIKDNKADHFELYDLQNDLYETKDIASEHPKRVKEMMVCLESWQESARLSRDGADYNY